MIRASLLALLLILTAPAPAAELAGVTMPDQVTVGDQTLELNGLGLRLATRLGLKFKVYVAGLYLEEKSSDAEQILASDQTSRIHMHFVRKVGKGKITGAWTEGFEANSGGKMAEFEDRVDKLNSWMPDMAKDDTITFTYVPGSGVEVGVNGESKGTIEGPDFARVLWTIFLGPEPPNAELKDGMLGG